MKLRAINSSSYILPLALVTIISICTGTTKWQPPIGIPDPGFGISEQRPSRPNPWNSEVPGYYYINNQTGTDNAQYGTPDKPRRTIPNPTPAGSYVELHGIINQPSMGGVWLHGNGNNSPWVANVSGPVWFVGQSNSDIPIFTSYEITIYGTYVYVDGISTRKGGALWIGAYANGYRADHIVVRNSDIGGDSLSRYTGLHIRGSAQDPVTNVVIYNNHFHDFGLTAIFATLL
jgi:hypothetical protein